MSKFIIQNDTELKEPSSLSFKKYHITNQERTMSGNLVVDYVATKNSLNATWNILTDKEFKLLSRIIENGKSESGFINLQFVEPETTKLKSITAYTEEINYYPYFLADGTVVWRDVSVNFVEV